MKQVVIVRHAKAVSYGYDDDFNRNLKDRGKSDAKTISTQLKSNKVKPDLVVSSPAKRALKTAKIFAENLNYAENKILIEDDLYEGVTTIEFIDILQALPEKVNTVFFFGHNPTVHQLCYNLTSFFNGDMPTCSTVGINFEIDSWKEISARTGKLAFHLMPRMF